MLRQLCMVLIISSFFLYQAQASEDPTSGCLEKLSQEEKLRPIKAKIAIANVKDQTLEMLANNNLPTKLERKLISLWASESNKCVTLGTDWRSRNYPEIIIALFNGYVSDLNTLGADLYSGKMSFGTFARMRAEKTKEFENNAMKATQDIKMQQQALLRQQEFLIQQQKQREAEIARQEEFTRQQQELYRQQEIERRRAEASQKERQLLLDAAINRRGIYAPRKTPELKIAPQPIAPQPYYYIPPQRSTHTNCYTFGNQIRCDSN